MFVYQISVQVIDLRHQVSYHISHTTDRREALEAKAAGDQVQPMVDRAPLPYLGDEVGLVFDSILGL